MNGELSSLLPSTAILGVVAVVALYLAASRRWATANRVDIRGAVRTAVVTILFQAARFSEELLAGFHERFPALFDLAPITLGFFVSFNVAWLIIWGLSAWGLATRNRAALFPLWFLSIGCIATASHIHSSKFSRAVTFPAL